MNKLIYFFFLTAFAVSTNANELMPESFVHYQVHKLSTNNDWESTINLLGQYVSKNNNDVAVINETPKKTIAAIGSNGDITLNTYPALVTTFNITQQICSNDNTSYPVQITDSTSDRDNLSCITLLSILRGDYLSLAYSYPENHTTDVFGNLRLARGESVLIKSTNAQGELILITPTILNDQNNSQTK